MRTTLFRCGVASIFVLALGLSGYTQEPRQQPQQTPAMPSADISAKCKAMMAEHEKVMSDMKAADQRLDELVAKMNAASGQAKVDATAAVVTISTRAAFQPAATH